jgi:translocation and assembly module TamB
VSEALNSQVQIRDFTFHLSGMSPTIDLYGVVVHGAPPYADPPLLEAEEMHFGVTITSLLHKTWYVGDVRLEHPVVRIFADRNGHTNLPTPKNDKASSSDQTNVFDLGIRHLLLERGEIYYNNRKSELSADLRDLSVQSTFALLTRSYSGTVAYRDGHFQLQDANPIGHNLAASFVATPEEFRLETANLHTANSRVSVVATVRNYALPQVHASYEATIDAGEFRRALKNSSVPQGIVLSSGTFDYDSRSSAPMMAAINAKGELRSNSITLSNESSQFNIRNFGADYSLSKGDVTVNGIHAQVLGGTLAGAATMRDITGSTQSRVSASLHGVSLAELQREFQRTSSSSITAQMALRGSLDATADATWGATMENVLARADATLHGNAQPAQGGTVTPLIGTCHVRYAGKSEQLSFEQSYIKTPETSITLNGTVSKNAALQVRVNSNDLHELEGIAAAFRPPASEPLGIYGRAALGVTISGSTRSPQVAGALTADNLRVRGSEWKLLRANFSANPSQIQVENGEIDSASRGRVTFKGSTGLQNWALTKTAQLQLQLNASQIDAAELLKAGGSTAPIAGTLSVDVAVNGTQLDPKGHGTVSLASARVSGEPIRNVDLRFQAASKQISANLKIDLPAGAVNGTLQYEPHTQSYNAELHAPNIKLDQLETLKARNLQVQGILEVSAGGRGTLRDPQLQAHIEIPRLRVRDQEINGLRLQTSVANHVANFTLDSGLLNTHAGGHGTIQLKDDYFADVSLDTQSIPLAPLFALYVPAQSGNLSGQTEIHATLRGPLKDKSRLEVHLLIPQLAVNYKNSIQLASEAPIRADYLNGVFNLQRSTIRGTGTEVTFQANVPMTGNAGATMLMHGSVDLRLAQLASPDITSGGLLQFDIDSSGHHSDPNVQGKIKVVNASFAAAGAPIGLQNGNGVLTLTQNRLDVTQFQGSIGGGKVTATGGILYRPHLQFDLAMAAKGVRVLYDQSVRSTLNSNLALTGNFENAQMTGQVAIDQLSFISDFDISDLMSQLGGDAAPPPTQGFSQNLNLDVGLQTPGGLNLTSRTLSLAGSANLHIRGTAAQPVLLGRLNLSGGDLIFSGNRYKLQGGTVDFTNTSRTQPVVDMSVNTTISQYDIRMHFYGPADHLHTNYSSDPSLPPSDIINLIAFGKTSEAAAANPTPPGALGAESLVASQVSNQITNRIEKLAGVSQLSVDPQLGSGQQKPGARVAIQQRITSKVFVTFSTDVTSTDSQVIQLEYQLSRKTSFNAVRDQNGGFSFQTTFRKRW